MSCVRRSCRIQACLDKKGEWDQAMVGGSQNAKRQGFAAVSSILLALTLAGPAQAQDRAGAASPGFYGGVSMREGVTEGTGITFGSATAAWSHLSVPTSDD